jgi:hypothetical protein
MNVLRGYGTRRLREYNDCNLPRGEDGGRFGANDDPRCAGGYAERSKKKGKDEGVEKDFDWHAATRQRAIHGAELGDEAVLGDPSTQLKDTGGMAAIHEAMDATTAGAAKRKIANELGDRWAARLAADDSLDAEAFDKWYEENKNAIQEHASSTGMLSGSDEVDGYTNAEDVPGYGAPNPEDAQSDYESYEEEQRQAADDAAYQYARDEFGGHWKDGQEIASTAIATGMLLHAEHAQGVFDKTAHPTLPLGDGEEFKPVGGVLTPTLLAEILTRNKLFTADEFDDALENQNNPSREVDVEETLKAIFDPAEEGADYIAAREELMQYAPHPAATAAALQGKAPGSDYQEEIDAGIQEFWTGVDSKYFDGADSIVDDGDAWDRYWDKNSDSVYDGTDYSDTKSFDSWYEDKYDIAPSDWEDTMSKISALENSANGNDDDEDLDSDDSPNEDTKRQRWAANWLVGQWASTSGDGSPVPVALQVAAEREFNLGKTFSGQFTYRGDGDLKRSVEQTMEKHGPVLQHFLRAMHDNTQEWLNENVSGDYVTLYRGFEVSRGGRQEPGMSSVDDAGGSIVGIRMQPMSSFSTRFNTSYDSFGTDFMIARVPKSQIIGSALTGYGCLSEFEVVVLGGQNSATVKSFFVNKANWATKNYTGKNTGTEKDRVGPSGDKREGVILRQAQERMDSFLRAQGRQQPALPISGERT